VDAAEVQAWVYARALEHLGRDLNSYSDDDLREVLADCWLEFEALFKTPTLNLKEEPPK
jgi:hypothetical protein